MLIFYVQEKLNEAVMVLNRSLQAGNPPIDMHAGWR